MDEGIAADNSAFRLSETLLHWATAAAASARFGASLALSGGLGKHIDAAKAALQMLNLRSEISSATGVGSLARPTTGPSDSQPGIGKRPYSSTNGRVERAATPGGFLRHYDNGSGYPRFTPDRYPIFDKVPSRMDGLSGASVLTPNISPVLKRDASPVIRASPARIVGRGHGPNFDSRTARGVTGAPPSGSGGGQAQKLKTSHLDLNKSGATVARDARAPNQSRLLVTMGPPVSKTGGATSESFGRSKPTGPVAPNPTPPRDRHGRVGELMGKWGASGNAMLHTEAPARRTLQAATAPVPGTIQCPDIGARTREYEQRFPQPALTSPNPSPSQGAHSQGSTPGPDTGGQGIGIQGDVYLDGALMGRWMSRTLARDAGRPPSGGSAFDPRRNPLPSGRMIGG